MPQWGHGCDAAGDHPGTGGLAARAADVLRRDGAARRARQRLAQGLRHVPRARRHACRVPRPDGQRRRDDRASSRERPGHVDVVRVLGQPADLPRLRHGHGARARFAPGSTRSAPNFELLPGSRAIIEVDIDRISTSCGYSVPLMDLVEDRDRLQRWAEAKGEPGLVEYRAGKNAESIDGLPGFGANA